MRIENPLFIFLETAALCQRDLTGQTSVEELGKATCLYGTYSTVCGQRDSQNIFGLLVWRWLWFKHLLQNKILQRWNWWNWNEMKDELMYSVVFSVKCFLYIKCKVF